MRINFIVPNIALTGGNRVIFEYANHLSLRGHDVNVIYPLMPYKFWRSNNYLIEVLIQSIKFIHNIIFRWNMKWFDLKARLVRVLFVSNLTVPDADVTFASCWPTAYSLNDLSSRKGKKMYFIHHYEIDSGPKELVDKTYSFPFIRITGSECSANELKKKLGIAIQKVILDTINFNIFYPEITREKNGKTVLAYYNIIDKSKDKRKGSRDAVKVMDIVKKEFPEAEFWAFGPKKDKNLPEYVKFHEKPTDEQLRKIYSTADIFFFTSHYEGFGLPPMEAMACRCAVASTDVGAVKEYSVPNETVLLSPPEDPVALSENIIKLLRDTDLQRRIAEKGYQHVKKFTWEHSTDLLEDAITQ
jgi:hypothetical protein